MNKQRVLTREDIAHRLARIAGHANSLKRLWEEERNYRDMLIQIAAVRAGLDQVARAILEQHLQQSISEAVSQAVLRSPSANSRMHLIVLLHSNHDQYVAQQAETIASPTCHSSCSIAA